MIDFYVYYSMGKINFKSNKVKFLVAPTWWNHEDLSDDFKIVPNPTVYDNLPNGEYLIRGNKKDHSKEYWVYENVWYQTSDTTVDNGHSYCIAGTYQMFPNLSNSQWEVLNKTYRYLKPIWQRMVLGHNHWVDCREIGRNTRMKRIKLIGR